MNKKYILILMGLLIVFFIFMLIFSSKKLPNLSDTKKYIVRAKNDYVNFKNIEKINYFEPFYLKITLDREHLKNYTIVGNISYLGYYLEDNEFYAYIKNSDKVLKIKPKSIFLNKYYILNVSNKNLVVLDIDDGSIKLIVPKKIGGND
ncbi:MULTISPECIES: hypothetical protein [unclassified Thermosipho (in: thermotogales)]|uniref:hypothetical protein n=1 Tax=unclassified Thermosipho (in: thermotogales) TaxID=2676525 RepID=UPI0009856410|nr:MULTISPECIES: hypothetical protein [unclassified Thermosipho (in: thermotogales)]MBT1248749.1 hypothetical protein [Thermosipho sp. 1244]